MGWFRLCPLLLAALSLTSVLAQAQGQTDQHGSLGFFAMTTNEQIMNIAQFLAGNPQLTKQLIKVAESLQWLEQGTNGNPMGDKMMPMVLDYLPTVLNHTALKLAVKIGMDEVKRAQPDKVTLESLFNYTVAQTQPHHIPVYSAPFNDTLNKVIMQYTLQHANWLRAVNRYLTYFSARQILQYDPKTVNSQCYNDTTDYLDTLVGIRYLSEDHTLGDPKHEFWAIKMLDATGKPAAGVMKANVHWLGSYGECYQVHAYLPKNKSMLLGYRPHDYVTEFDTRFCRVSFDLPQAVIDSFGVDTHGIKPRLTWDLCVPDSCHRDDIHGMFPIERLQGMGLTISGVYCKESDYIKDDGRAIAALVILAILVSAVLVTTVIETVINFYNNNFLPPESASGSSIEDNTGKSELTYDNRAFQPDNKSKEFEEPLPGTSKQAEALPANYVHHKEDDTSSKSGPPGSSYAVSANGDQKRNSPPPSYSARADKRPKQRGIRVPKLVQAFSVISNMPKVLSGKKNPSAIHCLNGIRFFSMLWIILGHTFNYGVLSTEDSTTTVNLIDAAAMFERFTYQGILAGGFAVDTFFLLSALLVTYLTLKDLTKKRENYLLKGRRTNWLMYWLMFYLHRFLRLTPLYMIVLMTYSCLTKHIAGGPLFPQHFKAAEACKHNWWTNLIYINNLYKVDDMCMGWTWYLSNDMQFYWISPIFLVSMFLIPAGGVLLVIGLMCGGISAAFYLEHRTGGDIFSMKSDPHYWKDVYVAPWSRVSAYMVGMLLGFILFKFKKTTLKLSTALFGWLATWTVGLFICYITYTKRKSGGEPWDAWENSVYEAFGRPVWAALVGWIIFACHNNRGGYINTILSWEGFLPMSRLTYATYLLHPVVMTIHVYSRGSLIFINDNHVMYEYIANAIISFLVAFVFSLLAEAPALNLEKLAFGR